MVRGLYQHKICSTSWFKMIIKLHRGMQKVILFLTLYIPLDLPWQVAVNGYVSTGNKFVPVEKSAFYRLGNTRIALEILKYGSRKDIVMVSLHDDETSSVKAAKKFLEKTGGQLIRIKNEENRYLTFSHSGRKFRFDPNRIFTKIGIQESLREQNVSITPAAIKLVDGFGKFILKKIPSAHTVIALHNNKDGGLSIHSYVKGGFLEENAMAVHRSDRHDPDNFFFTTDRRLSRSLSAAGYNVVFQNNKKASDDGSLSIYYGRRNKSYINIEAEDGMQQVQETMIKSVVNRLRSR